ncbi:MAG TPA: hypothetical protein VN452_04535 [Longilinea sp.]|nr:hypothetical protein [Longilinea sp.]
MIDRLSKLFAGLALIILTACQPSAGVKSMWLFATATPFQPAVATATPFLPFHPTLTPAVTQPVEMNYQFQGIDFSPGAEEITLRFWPASDSVNRGNPIKVRFLPGETCIFGDHFGCVSHFLSTADGEVIWISVHSGVGGEGQELRNSLEGTGINSAGFSLDQTLLNLDELKHARMTLQQGQMTIDLPTVIAVARIPASQVTEYLDLPYDQALATAFENDPDSMVQIQSGKTTLIIETCGWSMPGEPGNWFVADTTASIYLVAIQ